MKSKKMVVGKEVLIGLIVLICISNISAFAISSEYWRENPLRLYPGESKEFSLVLQNLGGTSDLNLRANVISGYNVLKVADPSNIYTVPAGQKGQANFIATVPSDSKPGKVYSVQIDFLEVKDSKSGEFGFGTSIGQSFDIVTLSAVEQPTGLNKTVILYVIAGIILLVIVIWILRKVKKRKPHHRKRRR